MRLVGYYCGLGWHLLYRLQECQRAYHSWDNLEQHKWKRIHAIEEKACFTSVKIVNITCLKNSQERVLVFVLKESQGWVLNQPLEPQYLNSLQGSFWISLKYRHIFINLQASLYGQHFFFFLEKMQDWLDPGLIVKIGGKLANMVAIAHSLPHLTSDYLWPLRRSSSMSACISGSLD